MALPDLNRQLVRYAQTPGPTPNGNVQWFKGCYSEAAATVLAAGFFNFARGRVRVGDVADILTGYGGTAARIGIRFATVPATGDVTVAIDTDLATEA